MAKDNVTLLQEVGIEDQPSHASITSMPSAGQIVDHFGRKYVTVKEGLAYILTPPDYQRTLDTKAHQAHLKSKGKQSAASKANGTPAPSAEELPVSSQQELQQRAIEGSNAVSTESGQRQDVFYNEIMQYNRDLSVLAIKAFGEDSLARSRSRTSKRGRLPKKHNEKGIVRDFPSDTQQNSTSQNNEALADDLLQPPRKRPKFDGSETSPSDSHTSGLDTDQTPGLSNEDVLKTGAIDGTKAESHETTRNAAPIAALETKTQFRVLDALSATGLRALRYCHEIPFVTSVTANDLSPKAVEMIENNVKHNKLDDKIKVTTGNAIMHMYGVIGSQSSEQKIPKYNVIDLDPYGSAAPFLDSAVQALQTRESGMLCVTCTDTAVFSSTGYPEKTFSTYGGTPLKSYACHEGGLRLLLHSIAMVAARYGLAMEPLLSLSIDYYARVFVRLRHSPADVKFLAGKTMMVYNCSGCPALIPQWIGRNTEVEDKKGNKFFKHGFAQGPPVGDCCSHCGFKHHICGPMWGGPLHNPAFIERILSYLPDIDKSVYSTADRLEGMLTNALEETSVCFDNALEESYVRAETDADPEGARALISRVPAQIQDLHPFYFSSSALARCVHTTAPSMYAIRGALRHAGYKATRTHAAREGIKTNAPWNVIWHVMREWVRQNASIKEGALTPGMAGWKIMQQALSQPSDGTPVDGSLSTVDVPEQAAPQDRQARMAGSVEGRDEGQSTWVANFDDALGKDVGKKLKRYQLNPRANWGPMAKAVASTKSRRGLTKSTDVE